MKEFFHSFPQKYSLDIATRYLPIIEIIRQGKNKNPSILEVGSGDAGITIYYPSPITGVDINFSKNVSPLLRPKIIKGTGLPFKKCEFDYVVSVDMLEHLPPKNREESLAEMMRVARQEVILVVPTGEDAEKQDRKLHKLYAKIHGKPYHFLQDHVKNGLPTVEEIKTYTQKAAAQQGRKVRLFHKPLLNLKIRFAYMRLFITKTHLVRSLSNSFGLLVPFRKYLNFGKCYRTLFTISFE